MSMLKDIKAGEELSTHIDAVSAMLTLATPGTEEYELLLEEYTKLVRLQIEDEVKEIETGEKTLSREDAARNNAALVELREKELEEKALAREDASQNNAALVELREKELEEKRLTREAEERANVENLKFKEKELEEKRLTREAESRDRKIQMGLTLLQIGVGVVIPIATTAATVAMLNKCGQFETGDDPQIWTTLTSRQVISSIAKGLGIKTK